MLLPVPLILSLLVVTFVICNYHLCSLDPDQAQQICVSDLYLKLDTLMKFLKDFFSIVAVVVCFLFLKSADDKKTCKVTQRAKS